MIMDLLSKLHIAEKNIPMLIMRLIHQYRITKINNQYRVIYQFNDDTNRMYSDGFVACNYRDLKYTDPSEDCIFRLRNDMYGDPVERSYAFPFRYCYSSGKNYAAGYK